MAFRARAIGANRSNVRRSEPEDSVFVSAGNSGFIGTEIAYDLKMRHGAAEKAPHGPTNFMKEGPMNAISSFWGQLEGTVLDGKYNLRRCLSIYDDGALFLTEVSGSDPRPAMIKLIPIGPGSGSGTLSRWRMAMELSHPNLVRIFAAESAEIEGVPVLYAVMDCAEDNLGNVLRDRGLSEAEALDALESILPALQYLHDRGLVHGHLRPGNILAVGNTIKVSSDEVGMRDERPYSRFNTTSYDAPEVSAGIVSTTADVWSVGMTVCEMLTQALPDRGENPEHVITRLPEPFRELVRHCLCTAPDERWSVAQIAQFLKPVAADGGTPPIPQHRRPWKWIALVALTAAVLLAVLNRKTEHPAPPSETRPAPVVEAPQPENRKPTPIPQRSQAQAIQKPPEKMVPRRSAGATDIAKRAVWRVIAYTYTRSEDAGKMVRQINSRWPEFKAEVFDVNPGEPPYLVSLGGRMPREDAVQLLDRVHAAGLPADSYTQNFLH
jgi:serine/threonine protein kinase